jgi:phage tail-like protein
MQIYAEYQAVFWLRVYTAAKQSPRPPAVRWRKPLGKATGIDFNGKKGKTSMAQLSVKPKRFDPYKQFKFRVKWDERYVAGIEKVSALKRITEVVSHREGGGGPSLLILTPGQTTYEPIVLVRGRTHDLEFEEWANKVVSLENFRKDIIIELHNKAGRQVMAFKAYRCWPSEYIALCDLDAGNTSIAFESITLQYEGWVRL